MTIFDACAFLFFFPRSLFMPNYAFYRVENSFKKKVRALKLNNNVHLGIDL